MYHAQLGRFVSRDPIGYEGDELNLFRYVKNGPTNGVDPAGLDMPVCPPWPPPRPAPGVGSNAKRPWKLGYFWPSCCTSKDDRVKLNPIPVIGNPIRNPIPGTGPGGGNYEIFPSPRIPPAAVGSGGCDTCYVLVVRCPGFVAVFHFTVGDSPGGTLRRFSWPNNCHAIICGGNGEDHSNCLGDDVMDAAKDARLDVMGVSPNSGCGVDANGDWYQYGR